MTGKRSFVSIILYNNESELIQFIDHVLSLSHGSSVDICVTVNSSLFNGQEYDSFKNKLISKGVIFLEPGSNLGYFGAMNYAYTKMFNVDAYDYFIVSNTDLTFDKDFFKKLKQCNLRDVCVIAPKIISSLSRTNQNPMYIEKPSRMKFYFLSQIFSSSILTFVQRLFNLISKKLINNANDTEITESREIYAAHGALILISSNFFERGGSLHYPMFLFCEEIFLAEAVKRLGGKIIYEPSLISYHEEHKTTGFIPSRKMRRFLSESHLYCYENLLK